jgi:aminoglycoside 6'-N-acetyltransferase
MSAPPVRLVAPIAGDIDLIARWVGEHHVCRWWGDPEEVFEELEETFMKSGHVMIEAEGFKVGFLVYAHPTREELDTAGLHDVSTDCIDVDLFIGEPDALGRGFGREALRLAVEHIFAETPAPFIIAAMSAKNTIAVETAQKAGFDTSRKFNDPGGGAYVLCTIARSLGGAGS